MSIDWTRPVELNDGTPVVVVDNDRPNFVTLSGPKWHPANPRRTSRVVARRENGLVLSNHRYRVRNIKEPNVIKYQIRDVPDRTFDSLEAASDYWHAKLLFSPHFFIFALHFDEGGEKLVAVTGPIDPMPVRPKVHVAYYNLGDNFVYFCRHPTEKEARETVPGAKVLKVTTTDGVATSAELLP